MLIPDGLTHRERSDVAVHDEEAWAEIELMSDLIIAASDQDGPLTEEEVDRILGLAG